MADKEISSLTAATTPLAGTELVHIDQGGDSRKALLSDVVALSTGAMLASTYDPDANGIIAVAQGGTNAATASGARTNLGLGTMAVQGAGAVAITGGSVTGITDLTVADGGTGASDASTARTNLGLAIGTDVQAYSANLAGFAATTVANVQNRDNHTGTQLAATISDFSTAADLRIAAAVGVSVQAYSALLDSVSALSLTAGDIIYATGSDAVASLPVGAAGQVLAVNGSGEPAWDTSLVVGGLIAANNLNDVSNASTALTNLGVSAFAKTILDDTTADATLTTLGFAATGKALAADATAADAIDTLGLNAPTAVFETKALAEAFTPSGTDPNYLRVLSRTGLGGSLAGGQEALYEKVGSLPSHDNYIRNRAGVGSYYERVPAAPRVPASITELGCLPSQGSSVDVTPAFNKVLVAAENSGFINWYAPPGAYDFLTRPNDIDFDYFTLAGDLRSTATAVFRKRFVSNGTNDAILNMRKGYFTLENIELIGMQEAQLVTGGGTVKTGVGSLISVISQTGELLGYCNLRNINMTSDVTSDDGGGVPGTGACVAYPLKVSGVASGTSSPGVRHLTLTDVVTFGGESGSAYIECTQGLCWNGGGTSRAGGKSAKIHLVGNSTTKSAYTQIAVGPILDGVAFTWAEGGTVIAGEFAGGSITFDANSVGATTIGYRGGGCTVSNAAPASNRHIDPIGGGKVTVSGTSIIAASPGTAVNFGVTFAAAPQVVATVQAATFAYLSGAPTTTGCTLISNSGSQTVHWAATGRLA